MIIYLPKSDFDAIWLAYQQVHSNNVFAVLPDLYAGEEHVIVEQDAVEKMGLDQFFIDEFGESIYERASDFTEEFDLSIYDFCLGEVKNKDVREINFKKELVTSLYWEREWKYGRILKQTAYAQDENANPDKTRPIVEIIDDYFFDVAGAGYVSHRMEIITWFKKDGSPGYTRKYMPKSYREGQKGPDEAERRRKNIVNYLKQAVQELLIQGGSNQQDAQDDSTALLASIQAQVDGYVKNGQKDLLVAIQNHPATMFDSFLAPNFTVRAYILSEIDYWSYEENGGHYRGSLL